MKPQSRHAYPKHQRATIRSACISFASLLPAPIRDRLTIVGGLVPLLLVPEKTNAADPHPGTLDLDVGVEIAWPENTLEDLSIVLSQGKFVRSDRPNRWQYPEKDPQFWIDTIPSDGWLPEIRFAFQDRVRKHLNGPDLFEKQQSVELWVAGPAAFVLLKALAFERRKESKDAFDLFWFIKHLPNAQNAIYQGIAPLISDRRTLEILNLLRDAFSDGGPGPEAVARFATGQRDDDIEADAVGLIAQLLETLNLD